ncbi:MAG: tRNA isopentenyl-2-thiomethyl-A-37 hydroxylase MiaE, partial [Polyangiaceae bacterium]
MLCLKVPTDAAWTAVAAGDADAVLIDHAHCEIKAASNALSLAARHPDDPEVVRVLTDLAREEIEHFQRVHTLLVARGLPLGPPPVDGYAAQLRRAAQSLPHAPPVTPLVDRLLVGALIEARSCER